MNMQRAGIKPAANACLIFTCRLSPEAKLDKIVYFTNKFLLISLWNHNLNVSSVIVYIFHVLMFVQDGNIFMTLIIAKADGCLNKEVVEVLLVLSFVDKNVIVLLCLSK